MDLISVIVPVYNSAPYIEDCVKSVLKQTHTYFELILVDDGSDDPTKEICQELCRTDSRIHFLSQGHKGVASARNTGINAAKGKYLFFLDSDDAVHSNILEYLYRMLDNSDSDVAVAEYVHIQNEDMQRWLEYEIPPEVHPGYTFLECKKALRCFTYGFPLQLSMLLYGIGGKMIRSDTVRLFRFDETLSNGEDTKFMYQIITEGASVAVLYQGWYYYRKHGENSTKKCSMQSYESMYTCQRYLSDQEAAQKRIESALVLEKSLLHSIISWYARSRDLRDRETSMGIKRLAEKEKRLDLFSYVDFRERRKFCLAFQCFPMYSAFYRQNKGGIHVLNTENKEKRVFIEADGKMNTDDLISVIIPIYNSSQYICECVESVLIQTYTYLEVLLVDDGSEDKSQDMCRMMCKKDKRIQYIYQDHKGVSAARNAGIEAAKGKYLFFLDADDTVHPRLLEMLYKMAESTNAPIASEGRYYADDGKIQVPEEWGMETEAMEEGTYRYLDNENAVEHLISGNPDSTLFVIGGKLVRREILKSIRFDEKLTQREDEMFLYQLLQEGQEVVILCRNWYYCRLTECGIERQFSDQSCQAIIEVERHLCKQEVEAGRIYNALEKEEASILLLMGWYESARDKHDKSLIRFVKKLAGEEKKLWIFSQVSWISKMGFYLKFEFYPFYRVIHRAFQRHPQYNQWKWDIKYKNMLRKRGEEIYYG